MDQPSNLKIAIIFFGVDIIVEDLNLAIINAGSLESRKQVLNGSNFESISRQCSTKRWILLGENNGCRNRTLRVEIKVPPLPSHLRPYLHGWFLAWVETLPADLRASPYGLLKPPALVSTEHRIYMYSFHHYIWDRDRERKSTDFQEMIEDDLRAPERVIRWDGHCNGDASSGERCRERGQSRQVLRGMTV